MIVLYNTFYAVGWGPLQVTYVVEILPYQLRARVGPSETSLPFKKVSANWIPGAGIIQFLRCTCAYLQPICQSNRNDEYQMEM